MTARPLTAAQLADLAHAGSPHVLLGFLEIRHPQLPATVRAVSDVFDYQWDGRLWKGIPFMPRAVTDIDGPPSVELRVQNVDRALGRALRDARGRARVSQWWLSSEDFDLGADPRVPLPGVTPQPLYRHLNFELVDVDASPLEITGRLMLRDFSQEPLGRRATQESFPGLWA